MIVIEQQPITKQKQIVEQRSKEDLAKKTELNNEKTFYVLKRRSLGGRYEPVALYSKSNNFLGLAVFTSLDECIEYQKEFDDRLMKRFLNPKKYRKDFASRIQYVESCKTRNSGLTKIFEEKKQIPKIR